MKQNQLLINGLIVPRLVVYIKYKYSPFEWRARESLFATELMIEHCELLAFLR